MAKRSYNRRTEDELIEDLQRKITELQDRVERTQRPDSEVVKQFPKLQRSLREFAKLAAEHGRADIANSTTAFLAGLDRAVNTPPENPARNPRSRRQE